MAVDLVKRGPRMKFIELPMPSNHQWILGEWLPTSVKFFSDLKTHKGRE
ncbi:MAG TPA: hypothetical protein VLD83_03645 [Candidatus Binatia bacterium]|nr:hypothetical protein [Candidatus Binatia bacterium]